MPRSQERVLYQARVGTFPIAGGAYHRFEEDCPLCNEEDAMCRNGGAIEHLLACVPTFTSPPLKLDIEDLWLDPHKAAAALTCIAQIVRNTSAYQERINNWHVHTSRANRNAKKK